MQPNIDFPYAIKRTYNEVSVFIRADADKFFDTQDLKQIVDSYFPVVEVNQILDDMADRILKEVKAAEAELVVTIIGATDANSDSVYRRKVAPTTPVTQVFATASLLER